ncbi:peptidase dimerization domain-containing protein [Terrilactibacillus sp. S3-3]|nr:peptidase dimerization domain-containing protein [Terrilactibacillus sp. S3-3]
MLPKKPVMAGLEITVKGQSAHGSEPAGGVNAAFLLADVLAEVPFAAPEKQFVGFIANTLNRDFSGERLGINFKDDEKQVI